MSPGGWPIDTAGSTAVVAGLFVALNVGAWALVRRRRSWIKTLVLLITGLLVVVPVAAGANAYYAYVPTVGNLVGRRATLEMSHRDIMRMAARTRSDSGATGAGRHGQAGLVSASPVAVRTGPANPPPVPGVDPENREKLRGAVDEVPIPGVVSGFHARPAQVYLPPVWFHRHHPALPVVMLLHGSPGEPADWTRGGLADVAAEAWANAHGGMAPIVVMPDPNGDRFTDSQCVDGRAGRAETYLSRDVRDFIVSEYGANQSRPAWAVGGLSEGGTCAVRLALRHPEVFSAFLAFGADAVAPPGDLARALGRRLTRADLDAYSPVALVSRAKAEAVAGFVCAGSGEPDDARAARQLARQAVASAGDVQLVLLPGGHHTFRVWRDCFAQALSWVAPRLQPGSEVVAPSPTIS